eukprot:GHVL01035622.1.p1 GENE.GHVL01035622.1~~GHVL01035622.1.p1  ORF type:complete len:297 (+),score=65.05 GHVL01035622.1:65-955(+)
MIYIKGHNIKYVYKNIYIKYNIKYVRYFHPPRNQVSDPRLQPQPQLFKKQKIDYNEPTKEYKEKVKKGTLLYNWKSAAFTVVASSAMYFGFTYEFNKRQKAHAAITDDVKIGVPDLGGSWTLFDSNGRPVSDSDFRGKYLLIYFGFTFCPDICPQELEKQKLILEQLEKKYGDIIQPLYITVDPGRDTVAQLNMYCKEFHPRLLGLTGTPKMIKHITRSYRVYYNEGIRAGDDDYLVDHSIIQYFIGKNGKFRDFFGKNVIIKEAVDKLSEVIDEDSRKRFKRLSLRGLVSEKDTD